MLKCHRNDMLNQNTNEEWLLADAKLINLQK